MSSSPPLEEESKIVQHFVKKYKMLPHVEGGYYSEIFRNPVHVNIKASPSGSDHDDKNSNDDDDGARNLSTSIFYLLGGRDFSCFHSIKSFEQWHYYSGSCNLIIHILDPESKKYGRFVLNNKPNLEENLEEQKSDLLTPHWGSEKINLTDLSCFIPENWWFAAELEDKSADNYVMAGCTVSFGFDFRDFTKAKRQELLDDFCKDGNDKELEELIKRLTRD